ncbi:MAG: type II secretion system F family protein [Microbacterium sp.]
MKALRRRAQGADAAQAAAGVATVQRLAVLLEAGVAPPRAWRLLADAGDEAAADVAAALPGVGVSDVLAGRGGPWRQVAVAWRVAETVGAPLAASLRRFADALRDAQETRDDVAVALADPAATARLVAWLPLVAIGLGAALGFDVLPTLASPPGIVCVVAGLVLMLVARRWSARLVAKAQPDAELAGLQAETVAIALSAGVSVDRALAVVADAGGGHPGSDVRETLALSQKAGAPAVELLRAHAADARRRGRTEGRLRAARLGSRLLLPMGLCTLPAFLLLGVGPMLLSVLSGAAPVLAAPPIAP